MSKEIQEFINSARSQDIFEIKEYDYAKYDCEVATIQKAQKEKDINTLVNFWNEKLDNKYFELRHPIYNDIVTRAVCSVVSNATIVFMIDKDNKYPWVFAQHYCMINNIMIPNYYLKLDNNWNHEAQFRALLNSVKHFLCSLQINKALFRDIPFAISCQIHRPYHFFNEDIQGLLLVEQNKLKDKYITSKSFFIPENMKTIELDNDNFVFVRMLTFNSVSVFSKVVDQSLQSYSTLVEYDPFKEDYDLTLWLGLPGERRSWLEQIQGTALILRHFNQYFKKIKVYVDGMTAYDGDRADFSENKKLFNNVANATKNLFDKEECLLDSKTLVIDFETLKELLNLKAKEDLIDKEVNAIEDAKQELQRIQSKEKLIVFKSLAGYDYRTKICYCNDCDVAISDSGTTALLPCNFFKKPCVLIFSGPLEAHSNGLKSIYSAHKPKIRLISKNFLITKDIVHWDANYHIPPQHIYNLAAEVLEELSKEDKLKIKNLKMHRLFVPEVELVKRQYDLAKALACDLPLLDENNIEYFKKIGEYFLNKENEVENKNKELQTLKTQIQNLNSNILSLQNENKSLKENFLSPELKEQSLKLSLLKEKVKTKVLKNKILEKDLELRYKDIYENDALKENIKRLEQDLIYIKHSSLNIYTSAKLRVQNHLAYKLGQALILNSKSFLGYIRLPYVLSYIKEKHKAEQKAYNEKIFTNPSLKLPPLENYPDYEAALKEKECLTYKLGLALIKADKTWYKGGYVRFCFEVRRLKKEFKKKRNEKKNNVY